MNGKRTATPTPTVGRRSPLRLLPLLPLLHSGRFMWRLWLWIPMGALFSAGVYLGIDQQQGTVAPPFGPLFLLSPAYALVVWWVTDNVRSRMLAKHTVTAWLLLPLMPWQKTGLLLVRSAIAPFGGLWLGALLTGIVGFPEHVHWLLRYTPFSLGIALCLGAAGWNGSWIALDTKVFGNHMSYRSDRWSPLLTLLLIAALPAGVYFRFAVVPAVAALPIICAAGILYFRQIEVSGTVADSQALHEQRRESTARNRERSARRASSRRSHQPSRRIELLHRLSSRPGWNAHLYGWELLRSVQIAAKDIPHGIPRKLLRSGIFLVITSLLPVAWHAIHFGIRSPNPAALGAYSVFGVYIMYAAFNSSPALLRTLPLGPARIGELHAVRTLLLPLPALVGIVPVASGLLWLLHYAGARLAADSPPESWALLLTGTGRETLQAVPVVLTIVGSIYILLNLSGLLMQLFRRWTAAHVLLSHVEPAVLLTIVYISFSFGRADGAETPFLDILLPAIPIPAAVLTAAATAGVFHLRERYIQAVGS